MLLLFLPMDCWLLAFENVDYRTTCEHKLLCFAVQIYFREVGVLEEAYGKVAVKKTGFQVVQTFS
jgi:hypothetical protein